MTLNSARLPQVLICDDDATLHLAVKHCLKGQYECRSSHNGDEAAAILARYPINVLLLDVQMRTPDEGLRYLERFRPLDPDLMIIMISGLTDFATVKEAMRLGADDYVPKDFDPEQLRHVIAQNLGKQALLKRRAQQDFEAAGVQRAHALVGVSAAMENIRRLIDKVRASQANVTITGETGTGKEVVARQLRGKLPDGSWAPFVAIDSSTIQGSTAESVLFGHERGAFTGADRATRGIFEEADGGIVYFDEIANMPLDIQAKLLRVIQEREVSRMGSHQVKKFDFRVVCATNQDLDALAAAGRFKYDLLQRLQVLPIALPPLREHPEDIPALVEHFLKRMKSLDGTRFTEEAMAVLQAYAWPGNARELENVVAFVGAMSSGPEIDVADLPPRIRDAARGRASAAPTSDRDFYEEVAAFERSLLEKAIRDSDGNMRKLALRLNMDRSHLYTKLKQYGLQVAERSERK